ncbi:hypothetical protein C8Q80DRAFT_1092009 [Daedaleopsis nitida]|nr:hypothetical protein C8Q80DRAFT_1092009 [Daedaleopsis nitida]
MSSWKSIFKQGVACARGGNYEDAVARFSEALKDGGDGCAIYDARAAVYQKMGKSKEALRDCKSVIDLQPARWQGYAKSARLFLQIRKYDAAARMVELALARVPADQSTRRDELSALQTDINAARDTAAQEATRLASLRAYHFGKLPVEIANTMFSMVLAEEQAYAVTLAQVCKNWRAAILGTPTFWDTLILSDRNPRRKIKTWKERSKNRIRELAILADLSSTPSALDELRTLSMTHLRSLRLDEFPMNVLRSHLPLALADAVADTLEGFTGTVASCRGEVYWIAGVPAFRCQVIELASSRSITWSQLSDRLEHLLSCSITACMNAADGWPHLLWLLHRNQLLEQFDLTSFEPTTYELPSRELPSTITVPRLSTLTMAATVPDRLLPLLALPSLKTLQLHSIRQPLSNTLRYLEDGAVFTLTSLSIECAAFDPQLLIRVLAKATALESLRLVAIADKAANVVLDALARPPTPAPSNPLRVYCPSLRHLDCSKNNDVTGGPLVRLVKLRLQEAEATSAEVDEDKAIPSGPNTCSLESLTINDCPLVDPDVLPWLRQSVPSLSVVYMSRKAAGWKR